MKCAGLTPGQLATRAVPPSSQAEVDNAELALATAPSLEVISLGRHGETVLLRDLLVHMIEEYAGHADLLRECVDGATDD